MQEFGSDFIDIPVSNVEYRLFSIDSEIKGN